MMRGYASAHMRAHARAPLLVTRAPMLAQRAARNAAVAKTSSAGVCTKMVAARQRNAADSATLRMRYSARQRNAASCAQQRRAPTAHQRATRGTRRVRVAYATPPSYA